LELEVVLLPLIEQDGRLCKVNNQPGEPMRKYRRVMARAKEKVEDSRRLALEAQLPLEQIVAEAREDVEAFAAELGLIVIRRIMEADIQRELGPWGKQLVYPHGSQPVYRGICILQAWQAVA
jgi:hypothetical protein